jgi:hypothetical protein
MIGQYLLSLQEPDNKTDWFILNTNISSYEFRLGGLKLTTIKSQGRLIDLKFDKPKIIRVMTDDFAVYIELDNGFCIVHSDTFIDSHGETSFEIYIHKNEFFINDGGLEGMLSIKSFD